MSQSPPPHKDRRLLALLALAVLLFGVAAGVELCRRLFLKLGPESLAGDFGFKLPPPAPEPPPEPERAPAARKVSAAKFLRVLAKEAPRPVARRFVAAFTRRPRLKKAFMNATSAGLDKTPATALLKALMAEPEFKQLVIESRSDPGFRNAFAQLAGNPDVGESLRAGTVGLVRPPPGVTGPGARPAPGATFASAPPPTSLAGAPDVGSDGSEDERGEDPSGREAHEVSPRLGRIETVKRDQSLGPDLPSMFKEMDPQFRQHLEERCEEFKDTPIGCDPRRLCGESEELLQACKDACAKSPKCPPDAFD